MMPTIETPVFIPVSTKATSICVLDVTGLADCEIALNSDRGHENAQVVDQLLFPRF
jgi:hypothetical protein